MSSIVQQTYQVTHDFTTSLRRKLPTKYAKIIAIVSATFGFWAIRNVFWKILNRMRSYPAGPLGIPFFGCFFPFAISPISFIIDIAETYGPVAFVPLMFSNNLFINDPVIVKQLFQTMKVTTRPLVRARREIPFVWTNGHEWTTRRKFFSQTAMTLSNSSFVLSNARRSMESVVPRINQRVEQKELWFPDHDVAYFAINNVWTAMFDHVLSVDDPFVSKFSALMERATHETQFAILLDLLSNYSGVDFISRYTVWKLHDEADDILRDWMSHNGFEVDHKRKILKRIKSVHPTVHANGKGSGSKTKVYADFLIEKMESGEIEYEKIWADLELIAAAGIDTTQQTGSYGFLLLAKHPAIQQRVHDELGMFKMHDYCYQLRCA